jgi:hypothetical protein
MTIRTLLWSPDTCKCVYKLQYDDAVDPIVHTLQQVIKSCPAHQGEQLDVIFDENRLKNQTMAVLKDTVPELTTTDRDGNIILKRDEISYRFEGTAPNRTLRIITKTDISAYEQEIKDALANRVDVI